MHTYRRVNGDMWEVGYWHTTYQTTGFSPSGAAYPVVRWVLLSKYKTESLAEQKVNFLNGGGH